MNIEKFIEKFDCNPLEVFKTEIEKMKNLDLLELCSNECGACIKLTKKGIDFANVVWEEFI